jgi:hypothetical protein
MSSSAVDRNGLSFAGRVLTVDGKDIRMPHVLIDAARFESGVVVVFDYMEFEKAKRCENLWGLDLDANRLWVAEAPGSSANSYVSLVSSKPLKAWNFACFICTLDPASGRLLEAKFTK